MEELTHMQMYCESCNLPGYAEIPEVTGNYFIICENCENLTSEVYCAKCQIGGDYVRDLNRHPQKWVCPGCKTEYTLPIDFYQNPIPLHVEHSTKGGKPKELIGKPIWGALFYLIISLCVSLVMITESELSSLSAIVLFPFGLLFLVSFIKILTVSMDNCLIKYAGNNQKMGDGNELYKYSLINSYVLNREKFDIFWSNNQKKFERGLVIIVISVFILLFIIIFLDWVQKQ